MNHYICGMSKDGYKGRNKDCEELAVLKYSMSNRYAQLPYTALKAIEYYYGERLGKW